MEETKSLGCCLFLLICLLTKTSACTDSLTANVSITHVENDKGADGSPPSYYHGKGEGLGINNWVIYLQGGGWCTTVKECQQRSTTHLGSSKNLADTVHLGNILRQSSDTNPDFCDWNRVYINYCDGSSFTGDVDTIDPAILSGTSAGGTAAILHCDRFRSLLPFDAKVKCFSDSAYFLHEEYLMGEKKFDTVFEGLITLHGSSQMLPSSCTEELTNPSLVEYNLSPMHKVCLLYQNCTLIEMGEIEGLRLEFLHALPIANPSFRGIWVTSCIAHNLIEPSWSSSKTLSKDGKDYPDVFGNWFYDRCATDVIDLSLEAKNCSDIGINIVY
nr:pectin acetylesterase 8-like [Ipomoea batatas]